MKENIHPKWYEEAKVVCACGNAFTLGSTMSEIHTEICSQCHPFFTGKEKLIDTEGLVEKFEKKRAAAAKAIAKKKTSETVRNEKQKKEYRPGTLKEMLEYAARETNK